MTTSIRFGLFVLLLSAGTCAVQANQGDVRHIVSHNAVKVVTDPSKGQAAYRNWAVFPSSKTEYRRAVLYVTYRCPDSLHCGEWDYIDGINLRRVGGTAFPSKDLELARMISPYGARFGPAWKFTWHVDVSDFAFLLHDSVEVEFNHGGYESNTDRGWLVTLDFEITEGKPAMRYLGMDTLWNGTFPYGDSAKPIEKLLHPISFIDSVGADVARLRIMQTGHGMDDSENCAEFCSKYRRILFDDSVIDQRQIWRKCGTNSLFPQAGTWLFDRANWCPGAIVHPDKYDIAVVPNSTHVLDMVMQPYVDPKTPSANYYIHSYLFYLSAPWASNDVSLEEIVAPSPADEYSRSNPVCSHPQIIVRNSGREILKSFIVDYGISGEPGQTYKWEGRLGSQESAEITLPGSLAFNESSRRFDVALRAPNGVEDEYAADNALTSEAIGPPVYGTKFILAFKTNKDSMHNAYQLRDVNDRIVQERKLGTLRSDTIYRDTFNLTPGCYQFVVVDTAGDGLDFWFNPEGGYGYVRLLDMNGHLIKSFNSDFGSEIRHSFRVAEGVSIPVATDTLPLVAPFPIRSKGIFTVNVFLNEPADLRIVVADSSKNAVFERTFPNVKDEALPIDISSAPDGTYSLQATAGASTVTRRIKVKHSD